MVMQNLASFIVISLHESIKNKLQTPDTVSEKKYMKNTKYKNKN